MTEDLQLHPDDPLLTFATGYVLHEPSIEKVRGEIALAAGPNAYNGIDGKAAGVNYFNLIDLVADYLRKGTFVASRRKFIDCGKQGRILAPLFQQTGICDGCSFGEAAFVAWVARWVLTGAGDPPRECSFLWPYLGGRVLSITGYGDTGACPPYSAQLYHDYGVLPVNCGGKYNLADLPPHGDGSQEALCIQMRDLDNPLRPEWIEAASRYRCRIYPPTGGAESIADLIKTGRPSTFGCSYQAKPVAPNSNGVSSLYYCGGHETFGSGFFRWRGRLGFIKTESWGLFPADNWPENRVTIQTDDGPRVLYPGQSALWADEWMACRPECWAIDGPGSR